MFALGTSNPLSIIVVATKTSNSPFIKANINSSSFFPSICPWPIPTRAFGTKRWIIPATSLMFSILLLIKKTCPLRWISYEIASRIISSLKPTTLVSIGYLLGGGVVITDKSRAAINENCKVLGIGVAVNVSVSTLAAIVLSLSLTFTPNFCSSSTINNPKSLKTTFLLTNWCVPITMSSFPSAKSFKVSAFCFAVLNRFK